MVPQAIVALYNNVTNTELGAQAIPQPSSPIDDYDQYGVLSAYLSVRYPRHPPDPCIA